MTKDELIAALAVDIRRINPNLTDELYLLHAKDLLAVIAPAVLDLAGDEFVWHCGPEADPRKTFPPEIRALKERFV